MVEERRGFPGMHAQSSKPITNSNKKNTISSINDMKSTNQLYSFILYTTTAKSTEPKKAMEAIRKLEGEPADSSKKEFNQTAALDKFLEEKTASDVLVFYIPCNYDYSQSDEDAKAFVKKLQDSGAGAATMLVSNTMNRTAVAKAYNISESDVAVVGQANTTSSTTATTVSSRTTSAGVTSTASPSTTPASTSSETIVTTVSTSSEAPITTSREDVGSTTSPIASESTPGTSPTEGISTASSISEETTTEAGPTTSSSIKTSSSASAATTTTSGETEPTSGTTNSTTVVTTKLSEPTEGSDSTVASSTVLPTSSSTGIGGPRFYIHSRIAYRNLNERIYTCNSVIVNS
ncbi:hypothetical protein ANCCEY_11604 [Ancylostoma ceylanicum]|uniref:Uncharacterized protein n=1 Tax=Ancylostoma ceylanicum TaxID=53326 RepID=A0A0D6LBS2_9BILA|nr:hypothetical protein ANCCEY_11604 [Ancylostoma ceylanicum]